MPSLVATTSTPARKLFVRTHYVRTNNAKDKNESEVVCTIRAERIQNYVPNFFCGEPINPACKNCCADTFDADLLSETEIDF